MEEVCLVLLKYAFWIVLFIYLYKAIRWAQDMKTAPTTVYVTHEKIRKAEQLIAHNGFQGVMITSYTLKGIDITTIQTSRTRMTYALALDDAVVEFLNGHPLDLSI